MRLFGPIPFTIGLTTYIAVLLSTEGITAEEKLKACDGSYERTATQNAQNISSPAHPAGYPLLHSCGFKIKTYLGQTGVLNCSKIDFGFSASLCIFSKDKVIQSFVCDAGRCKHSFVASIGSAGVDVLFNTYLSSGSGFYCQFNIVKGGFDDVPGADTPEEKKFVNATKELFDEAVNNGTMTNFAQDLEIEAEIELPIGSADVTFTNTQISNPEIGITFINVEEVKSLRTGGIGKRRLTAGIALYNLYIATDFCLQLFLFVGVSGGLSANIFQAFLQVEAFYSKNIFGVYEVTYLNLRPIIHQYNIFMRCYFNFLCPIFQVFLTMGVGSQYILDTITDVLAKESARSLRPRLNQLLNKKSF